MSYADYDDYVLLFDSDMKHADLTRLLVEASDDVDRLTFGRIRARGFDNLTPFQRGCIKKAVCYQAEFIKTYGEYLNSPLGGFSVGDVSLSFGASNQGPDGVIADKKTLSYLTQSGLMSRRL